MLHTLLPTMYNKLARHEFDVLTHRPACELNTSVRHLLLAIASLTDIG